LFGIATGRRCGSSRAPARFPYVTISTNITKSKVKHFEFGHVRLTTSLIVTSSFRDVEIVKFDVVPRIHPNSCEPGVNVADLVAGGRYIMNTTVLSRHFWNEDSKQNSP